MANNTSSSCADETNVTKTMMSSSMPLSSPTPSKAKQFPLITANAHQTKLKWDKNGHYYEIIKKDVNWNKAKEYAEKQEFEEASTGVAYGGYLATITSPEENSWIVETLLSSISTNKIFLWLGGYQLEGYDNPSEGWRWISGEDWSWTNWREDDPNDAGYNERYLEMYAYSGE